VANHSMRLLSLRMLISSQEGAAVVTITRLSEEGLRFHLSQPALRKPSRRCS
jgi:hypothetical protein